MLESYVLTGTFKSSCCCNTFQYSTIITVDIENATINPIQAGVFWNHIGWGGGTLCPPLFLLYLSSNYHQTWHASTMALNLSKTVIVKSIVMSL